MKIDPDLFKKILLWCEENLPSKPTIILQASDIEIPGFTQEQIFYHTDLLIEQGYIKGEKSDTLIEENFDIDRLTMNGHQLLKAFEDENLGKKATDFILKYGLPLAPTLIKWLMDHIK